MGVRKLLLWCMRMLKAMFTLFRLELKIPVYFYFLMDRLASRVCASPDCFV